MPVDKGWYRDNIGITMNEGYIKYTGLYQSYLRAIHREARTSIGII